MRWKEDAALLMGIFMENPRVCSDFALDRRVLQQILLFVRILCRLGQFLLKS